ncbi:ABC transporter related protein [Coriobacterium glomerans PW2]|uniref:ABC transporter related protein n=1 Tax=Coriobacterium glomerans (strain ATCC 49209 / DSM 20642 / JCM 10262 / PW2) TaxID=700015 RepID=F2NAU3_CORGP|nr:ABC transporter ATP-binding protein [Coriobacterium glomerans]AEB07621.1 ABC transporter related protein [Coriobacterium glomerans PW2]
MTAEHSGFGQTVLAVCDLSVELGGRCVLDQVTFKIAAGELIGLIGSNGVGKTTLFRAVLGDIPSRSGQIDLLGHARVRPGEVGYVPQSVGFDRDLPLRARDLVALGLDGHRFGLHRRGRAFWKRVEDALIGVDAIDLADRPVGRLSGGQQQRVMIAAATVSDPALLILDEPLASLDPANEIDVVRLLDGLRHQRNMSVIMSSHDINPLLGVLDRVIYLANGHAVSGTTDEVVRTDVLSRLYGRPIEVVRHDGHLFVLAGDRV